MTLHQFWSGHYVSLDTGGRELNEFFTINVIPICAKIRRGDGS
jgi:hypothetical protein